MDHGCVELFGEDYLDRWVFGDGFVVGSVFGVELGDIWKLFGLVEKVVLRENDCREGFDKERC